MRTITDTNGKTLEDGSVIDIGQTVNGQSQFVVEKVEPLSISYGHDRSRMYEYDKAELIAPDRMTGEASFTIIGHADEIKN